MRNAPAADCMVQFRPLGVGAAGAVREPFLGRAGGFRRVGAEGQRQVDCWWGGHLSHQDCGCPQNLGTCNYELRVWNQSGEERAGLSVEVMMQTLPGNPAATFCPNNGGQYNSEQGTCTLSDGTVCEAWAYANGECP
jgi:putative hemolysin